MITYKLFRIRKGNLYLLFVDRSREMQMGVWLEASIGELVDETHVKSSLGPLALRHGFHSTEVSFADWIGKRHNGRLYQRIRTVWCECEVDGNEVSAPKGGLITIPLGFYYFRTKPNQSFPWIISKRTKINRMLTHEEGENLCIQHGARLSLLKAKIQPGKKTTVTR